MVGRFNKVCRRAVAAIALAGVLLYAGLLPWHMAMRAVQTGASATVTADLAATDGATFPIICHTDADGAPGPATPDDGQRTTSCPICAGMAAVQFAVLSEAGLYFAISVQPAHYRTAHAADAVRAAIHRTHNRGPPQRLA